MDFGGKSRLDIFFKAPGVENFVADITAVSDESYEKENPFYYFLDCLRKFFEKKGINLNYLNINIDSESIGKYGDRKVKSSLPEKKDIPQFVKTEFSPIVKLIKSDPSKQSRIKIQKDIISITFSYSPQGKYFTSEFASYNVPYALEKNPIYNSLKTKADQLKKSSYEGIMGIIICDAGCESLNNEFYIAEKYSQTEIIEKVFKNNSSISFVIVLSTEEKEYAVDLKSNKFIKRNFYSNQNARYPLANGFFEKILRMERFLPVPQTMPKNAIHYLKFHKDRGHSHYGGFEMSPNKIKISSRMITELFAGVLDFNKFDNDQKSLDTDKRNCVKEFFLRQHKEGRMMTNIRVEKNPDEDDDWIEFEYGEPDAAISKFK